MALRKLQFASAPASSAAVLKLENLESLQNRQGDDERQRADASAGVWGKGGMLLYGGVALGVLAGAAISTYLWRQRVRALDLLNASPLERAEQLISSCEDKLEAIERAVKELKAAR